MVELWANQSSAVAANLQIRGEGLDAVAHVDVSLPWRLCSAKHEPEKWFRSYVTPREEGYRHQIVALLTFT